MATIFWDCYGILLADFKEQNTTVTGEYYIFNIQIEGSHQREMLRKALMSEVIAR
jgi:ribosomal protein S6